MRDRRLSEVDAVKRKPAPLAPPAVAGILALLGGIERHGMNSPAAYAFRSALTRAGREADEANGPEALDALIAGVAAADPDMAQEWSAVLDTLWEGIGAA